MDRLLSNDEINLDATPHHWVRHAVGARANLKVEMYWTDFDCGEQTMIMQLLMTGHSRTTPLAWLKADIAMRKNCGDEYEYEVLAHMADLLLAEAWVRNVAVCRLRRSKAPPGAHRGNAFR